MADTQTIVLHVKPVTGGKSIQVELQENATVEQICWAVEDEAGLQPSRMRLLFNNNDVDLTHTLQASNIVDRSTIHLLLCSRRGSFVNVSFDLDERQLGPYELAIDGLSNVEAVVARAAQRIGTTIQALGVVELFDADGIALSRTAELSRDEILTVRHATHVAVKSARKP